MTGRRFRCLLAPALLALSLAVPPPALPAQEPAGGADLPPEATAARDEAASILALPAFRLRTEATPLERLGRLVSGFLRRSFDFLRRTVEFKYGTALATGVSMAVLGAAGLLLWKLRRRRARVPEEPRRPATSEAVVGRPSPPLSGVEQALSGGDLGGAAALLTDWFLSRAYEPDRPPDWRTNRELLPDLRTRGPLGAREWEALVAFHETLRYAGSSAGAATVGTWLERARRASP